MGYILSQEGVRVEKEIAITGMLVPTERKNLQRFLAMANYLGGFSPILVELQLPLRELGKNKAAWLWT